jgi:predicted ester cyclase
MVDSRVLPRNPQAIEEALAPDLLFYVNGQEMRGIEAWRQVADLYQVAIPDARMTHHEAMVEGDRVAIRWSGEATHSGPLGDIPASGNRVRWEGLDLFHLRDGKIVRCWIETDMLTIMQQIGAIPAANSEVTTS